MRNFLSGEQKFKITLLAVAVLTLCLVPVGFSPLYMHVLWAIGRFPGIIFTFSFWAIMWLLIGAISKTKSYVVCAILVLPTSIFGMWWTIASLEYVIRKNELVYFGFGSLLFIIVQVFCWIWIFKIKRTSNFLYDRWIMSLLMTLNFCWSIMTPYSIFN